MRRMIVAVIGLLAAGSLVLTGAGTSGATATRQAPKNPLAVHGSVVAGVTSVSGGGRDLVFDFTIRNHASSPVNMDFSYTASHAKVLDIICPLIASGSDIAPDTPACEPGALPGHASTQSAIVIQSPSSAGNIIVQACADDEDNSATARCTSLSIPDVA